jgi:hypothetical protein
MHFRYIFVTCLKIASTAGSQNSNDDVPYTMIRTHKIFSGSNIMAQKRNSGTKAKTFFQFLKIFYLCWAFYTIIIIFFLDPLLGVFFFFMYLQQRQIYL